MSSTFSSVEPHKGTTRLIRWWVEIAKTREDLPALHLIGNVPEEIRSLVEESDRIIKRPFLSDEELQATYRKAKALILPSEIEGFGLPGIGGLLSRNPCLLCSWDFG